MMNQIEKIEKIENSRGRFFGLETRDGRVFNARFVRSTANYVTVYDRNKRNVYKIAKSNVLRVNLGW